MEFVLVRIDDRLIHGQVALGWSRTKGVECILAIDDETAKDNFKVSLLKMATPPGVQSYIIDEKTALDKINNEDLKGKRTMLLVKSPTTLLHLVQAGLTIPDVNVGNLRSKDGKKLLGFVYVSNEDISAFKELRKENINFFAQSLPDQSSTDFNAIIDSL